MLAYRFNTAGQGIVDPDIKDDEEGDQGQHEYNGELLPDPHLHIARQEHSLTSLTFRYANKNTCCQTAVKLRSILAK